MQNPINLMGALNDVAGVADPGGKRNEVWSDLPVLSRVGPAIFYQNT